MQLAALSDKHDKLKSSHSELSNRYERLQKIMHVLAQGDDDAEGCHDESSMFRRRGSNTDSLSRKLLDILNEEFKTARIKKESPSS